MVELTTLFGLAETLAIIIGVIIALQQLRDIKQTREIELGTRQAQLFWQLTDKFTSKEGLDYLRVLGATWSSHEEWLERCRNDVEYNKAYRWLTTIFNSRGVLLREGLLDVRLVALMASGPTIYWWEKYQDVIYNERERMNYRRYCSEWEYSYNLLVKYLEEHPELAP
jgi:hypothetical protein